MIKNKKKTDNVPKIKSLGSYVLRFLLKACTEFKTSEFRVQLKVVNVSSYAFVFTCAV